MNQLTTQLEKFQFLPKTNLGYDMKKISDHIMNIYEDVMDYRSEEKIFEVPSKSMIVARGWSNFETMYMEYLQNGHDPKAYADVQYDIESGMCEDIDAVIEMWIEFKDYNSIHYDNGRTEPAFTHKETEYKLINDLHKGIQLFNLSYFNDTNTDFTTSGEINTSDWINPPITGVW